MRNIINARSRKLLKNPTERTCRTLLGSLPVFAVGVGVDRVLAFGLLLSLRLPPAEDGDDLGAKQDAPLVEAFERRRRRGDLEQLEKRGVLFQLRGQRQHVLKIL